MIDLSSFPTGPNNRIADDQKNKSEQADAQEIYTDTALGHEVDELLAQMDLDDDGFINFPEYIRAYKISMEQQAAQH